VTVERAECGLYYRVALEEQYPDRTLYLAVPLGTYETFFSLQFIQTVIQRFEVKVIARNL
jgi:hypothetical protein